METDYINLWKSIDLCSFRGAEIRDILIDNPIFSLPFAVQPLSCWSYFHVRILFLTCFFFFYFFFPWKFSYQWQKILKQFSEYFPGIQILKMKLLILQEGADFAWSLQVDKGHCTATGIQLPASPCWLELLSKANMNSHLCWSIVLFL